MKNRQRKGTARGLRIRFMFLQALFWCASCTLTSYAAAYFLRAGLQSTQCTRILLYAMVTSFAGQFLFGAISDRGGKNREVFVLCGTCSVILTLATCFFMQAEVSMVFFLYPLLCLIQAPMAAVLDSWEMAALEDLGNVLGISRGIAAAAYASFHFFYARAVESTDYSVIPQACILLYSVTLALALSLPSAQKETPAERHPEGKALLKNPVFMTLLPVLFLLGLAGTPNNTLKIVLYQNVGQDVGFLGIDSLCCSGVQTVLFLAAGKSAGKDPSRCLALSGVCLTGAGFFLCRAGSAAAVLFSETLIAAAYPFILLSIRSISAQDVTPGLRTTANAAADAIYGSISGMAGMLYAGPVLERSGVKLLLVISLLEYAAAALLSAVRIYYLKRKTRICSCRMQESCEKT